MTWPSGVVQTFVDVVCDQSIEIAEDGSGGFVEETDRPSSFVLYPLRPNHFETMTAITFDLPEARQVDLAIYDVLGKSVRRLSNLQIKQAGHHTVYWHGENARGEPVAPGMYFCTLSAGTHSQTRRVILAE